MPTIWSIVEFQFFAKASDETIVYVDVNGFPAFGERVYVHADGDGDLLVTTNREIAPSWSFSMTWPPVADPDELARAVAETWRSKLS
jgi:hypothetical protein